MLYEIKPLSPTKLSISVKKFYNNVSTYTYNKYCACYFLSYNIDNLLYLSRINSNNMKKIYIYMTKMIPCILRKRWQLIQIKIKVLIQLFYFILILIFFKTFFFWNINIIDNKDVKHKSIINCEKNYSRPKKKFKNVNHHKPYDLNPQLNKGKIILLNFKCIYNIMWI